MNDEFQKENTTPEASEHDHVEGCRQVQDRSQDQNHPEDCGHKLLSQMHLRHRVEDKVS